MIPKVSVIIISHDRPIYLKEAIDSLLKQTDPSWEAIIMETSAGMAPLNILRHIADSRIRIVFMNSDNTSALWNAGIQISCGKYISFLDDDNRKTPTFIEKLSRYLDVNYEKSGVACHWGIINETGARTEERIVPENITFEIERERNYIDNGGLLLRREVFSWIEGFDESFNTTEDWDLILRLLKKGGQIGTLQEVLSEYRSHSGNKSHRSLELGREKDYAKMMAKHTVLA